MERLAALSLMLNEGSGDASVHVRVGLSSHKIHVPNIAANLSLLIPERTGEQLFCCVWLSVLVHPEQQSGVGFIK